MIYELVLSKSSDKADHQLCSMWDTYGPGLSPGGVSAYLGISRQAVHYAIRHDLLDVITVIDADGEVVAKIIPMKSVLRYKQLRHTDTGQAPKNTGRLIPLKPTRLQLPQAATA